MPPEVPSRILIADDQADVLEALRLLLKPEGYVIDTASSPAQVVRALDLKDYDVVLIDLNYSRDTTSGEEGLDLLKRIRLADESLPVVVMTAWGSVDVAVEAMRRGARDFVQKPWDNERLLAIVRTQTELGRAIRLGRRLELANQALMADGRSPLLAESPAMRPVLEVIARVGPVGRQRAHQRRERHRQEPRRAGAARRLAARHPADGHRQRRRHGRRRLRERALRPRARRLHRRQGRPRRPLRAGRRRHALPRRDRQRALEPAGQAAARARDRRVRARRLVAHAQGRRAHRLGHQRRPGRRGRGRPLPPGSAVPPQHDRDRAAAAARSARGHPAARPPFPRPAHAALPQGRHRLRAGRAAAADGPSLARQRARARSRHRARGADGAGHGRSAPPTSACGSRPCRPDASRT